MPKPSSIQHRDCGRVLRVVFVASLDMLMVAVSYFFALLLRFDFLWTQIPPEFVQGYLTMLPGTCIIVVGYLWIFRLYHSVWSFASVVELMRSTAAWLAIGLTIPLIALVFGVHMPASYWLVGTGLAYALTTGIRFSYRMVRRFSRIRINKDNTRVMIIGAGEAGRAIIREIGTSPQLQMRPVVAIDDNPAKWGRYIEGIPIEGGRDSIAQIAERHNVEQIIFAVPSMPPAERAAVLELCQQTGLEVRAVPGMFQLIGGQVSVSNLRHVHLEDLLGREPVVTDAQEVRSFIEGRTVLVTGGGGSIGSELCRQVAKDNPGQLVIFDIYENNAYAIQQELARTHPNLNLQVLIGSVRDAERVNNVFETYRPDLVFHAAAHKHVPLMETSPNEAIKNNVFGTLNCARAAITYGTARFVLISTDKAVNPTNVMGATKRLCEMVIQGCEARARKEDAKTTFSAVRFGNVLGSNGSVVPLFEQQIAHGGPVTVTHPQITRYFMTIPEAVSLVLQSACYAEGGEIFVLDMGEPVRIDSMAKNLIRLAGFEPNVDIKIVYTGLRPGEKLYEERLMDEEGLRKTPNKLISVARPVIMDYKQLKRELVSLEAVASDPTTDVRPKLQQLVPTYHPTN
ncbi:MAG: nucleoside-diphosphate sugar epimerase/dehydratase [Coriobacteriales bacterium]|nr:nucleoside-diphosphate sugar epimerase/dehydratase [Coriobacteriales bacterium]